MIINNIAVVNIPKDAYIKLLIFKNSNLDDEFFANGTLKRIFENSRKMLTKFSNGCIHESTETGFKLGQELCALVYHFSMFLCFFLESKHIVNSK